MVASVQQQPLILQVMEEFQIVVGYERTEYKLWLDTQQQIQHRIENVEKTVTKEVWSQKLNLTQ